MGKHTPGPWRVEGRMYLLGGKLSGHIISRGINDHGDGPQSYICKAEGTTEEDARLIAAAPDLLDALKGLSFVAQTSGGTAGRDEQLIAAIDKARAALAKAGE